MATTKTKIDITARDRTRDAFRSADSRLKKLKGSVASLRGAFVAVAGAAGIGAMVKSVVTAGDQMQKLSIRLGVSVESLSQLRHVADLSGVSMQTLTLGMQRATRRIAEAAQGTGEAKGALQELNLSASQLVKLKPDQQLEAIAEAMNGVENQADKVRLAMKLFDTEGVALLQTMQDGAAGLRDMRDEADQLGLTMTRAEADQIAGFNDSLARLKNSLVGVGQSITMAVLPALKGLVDWLTKGISKVKEFYDSVTIERGAIEETANRLAALVEEQDKLRASLSTEGDTGAIWNGQIRRLREVKGMIAATREELNNLFRANKTDDDTEGGPLDMVFSAGGDIEATQEKYDAHLKAWHKHLDQMTRAKARQAQQLTKLEKQHQTTVQQYRAQAVDMGIGLLRMFGQKNKAFQIAAIAFEAAVAAKRIFIQTEVAAIAALTPPPIGLGPVAGAPLAASIRAYGRISAGLTLAAGAFQVAQALQGGETGATGTFAAEPATGLPSDAVNASATTQTTATTVTVNIGDSPVFSAEAVRNLIELINEQIDDGVVVKGIAVA